MLLLFEVQKLSLYHFNLLFFLFSLNALFVFLGRSQIRLDEVHIVGVATEDTFVVHDV